MPIPVGFVMPHKYNINDKVRLAADPDSDAYYVIRARWVLQTTNGSFHLYYQLVTIIDSQLKGKQSLIVEVVEEEIKDKVP